MRIALTAFLLLVPLAGMATPAFAQSAPPATTPSPVASTAPKADDADVASVDAIVKALYDTLSGPAGQPRDWNRLRSLFLPEARMMPVGKRPTGEVRMRMLGVNDYVATSAPLIEKNGFTERELARRIERFGNIAHVFSTYEARTELEPIHLRGINTIQLMFDGSRWWIVSLMWQAETPDTPLPKDYLPRE
ncbi:MAG: hypothetical protein IAE66_03195 [Xanthomonadaceae bacterium]|nr:hypothetical protein [Xanthomonadaceae bacterium]